MNTLEFWFDPVSPYSALAFARLPQALEGLSYAVDYRPVLFAALLQHHGTKGPAEVEAKRRWTFRQVHWLAQHHGIELVTPKLHPFNPLPLLRLLLACAPAGGLPNRRQVEHVLEHVWHGGGDATDPARLAELAAALDPVRDLADPAIKAEVTAELKAAADEAIAAGVFGVPSMVLGGRMFWGLDALPMLRDAIAGHPWFEGPAWEREGEPREGVRRN